MRNPISTYRIQFNKDFTFSDFRKIIPYLDRLGIKTIYASPIFESTPGSLHGYDVVNPQRINPEIGTEKQLRAISQQLSELGIQWLQDIVPNHMAYHPANSWLMDVLEKGQLSPYASYFDIDWSSPHHQGRLMVPFLGATLEEVIDSGELRVDYEDKRLVFNYQGSRYPLHLRSYATVLQLSKSSRGSTVQSLLDQIHQLSAVTDTGDYAQRHADFLETLAEQMDGNTLKPYLDGCLETLNVHADCIRRIADEQVYRLCHYGETDSRINFRRFFTVNGLICLNTQKQEVFDAVHQLPKTLFDAGILHGLRVDHIDGLFDPVQYLERLRQLTGEDAYIVVEKILQNNEELPVDWPIQGATGYAYLAMVNNLFTRAESRDMFTQFYRELLDEKQMVGQELLDKKAYILYQHMQGELDNLFHRFFELRLIAERKLAALPPDALKQSIGEFLIQCPVYRYYGNSMPLGTQEAANVKASVYFRKYMQASGPFSHFFSRYHL